MKKKFVTLGIVLISLAGKGQVEWKFFAKKITDKVYEIHLRAEVQPDWHIYSQHSPQGGPLPTKILFSKNPVVLFQGKIKEEGKADYYHDNVFKVDVYSYVDSVEFIQVAKLKVNAKTTVSGTVEFMACTKQQCLTPETIKYVVKLE